MSGAMYFLLSRDHAVLEMFGDISDARDALHASISGQYVARQDGTVIAYMSREGQSWKVISKAPPEARAVFAEHIARATTSAVLHAS